ncbi:MAG: hypothetical protein ACI9WC_001041 [Arenicella sp.]|jgi:hypothetical protein
MGTKLKTLPPEENMKTKLFIALAILMISATTQAKIAGKNVVLIHGFQASDLQNSPNVAQQKQIADAYFSDYWLSRSEANLYWTSKDRITGGIKDAIRTQFLALESQGTCAQGCVFVTHSTGDLVLRDALTRLGQWGINQSNFKVITVIDLAGAGGGTEIADIASSIAAGSGIINSIQKAAIKAFLGFTPTSGSIGVLNDLRPGTARSIATSNSAVPRLRFVGEGTEFLGITKPFISGSDDSVVPMHSACGARYKASIDSCSKSVRVNGQLRSSNGPSSLYSNHYPILMGEGTAHSEAVNNSRSGEFTTVTNNTTKGLNVDFSTSTGKKWWSWWYKVRLVRNGGSKSMSANIYDTLNN